MSYYIICYISGPEVKAVIVASSTFMLSVLDNILYMVSCRNAFFTVVYIPCCRGSMWPIKCVHLVFSLDHMQIKKPYGLVSD